MLFLTAVFALFLAACTPRACQKVPTNKMSEEECKCFIHYNNVSQFDEILITATNASLCKIIQCRNRSMLSDGDTRTVSEQSFQYSSVDDEQIILLQHGAEILTTRWFYHPQCQQNFTNKRLIEQAEKRIAKKDKQTSIEPPRKSQRRRESGDSRGETSGVLPKVCIICKKKDLFYNDKVPNICYTHFLIFLNSMLHE